MSAPLEVVALRTEPELPGARIRITQLAPWLARHDVKLAVETWPKVRPPSSDVLSRLRAADVVVVHKALPRWSDRAWLRALGRPLVFDFDDAIMHRHEPRWGTYTSLRRRARFEIALATYDAFVCGNACLASSVRGAKPKLIAPSPVPTDVPQRDHALASDPPRVGWIGLPVNLPYLEKLAPTLRKFASSRRFVLVVISDRAPAIEGVEVEHVPWSLATQERELASLDVGLMPLVDSPWTRGKCAYKALQYMAAGVPPIASRVGANVEVIEHGTSGFLASTDADWLEHLERLLADASLRARIGRAARERVVAEFSYERHAERWARFLREEVLAR